MISSVLFPRFFAPQQNQNSYQLPAASVDIEMEIGGTLQPDTYDIWGSCGNGVTSQKRTLLVTGLPVNITHQNLPVVYDNQIGFDLPSGFDGGVANAFAVMRCSLVFQPGWCFNTPKLIELTDAKVQKYIQDCRTRDPEKYTNKYFICGVQGFAKPGFPEERIFDTAGASMPGWQITSGTVMSIGDLNDGRYDWDKAFIHELGHQICLFDHPTDPGKIGKHNSEFCVMFQGNQHEGNTYTSTHWIYFVDTDPHFCDYCVYEIRGRANNLFPTP